MRKQLYILLDYYGRFYHEWDAKDFRLSKFEDYLNKNGFSPIILKFCDIDFKKHNFKDEIVLYSSCEGGQYKDYIEDILLGIQLRGGILIPNFYLFRAHENKSFQQVYRDIRDFGNLNGKAFGALKDFSDRVGNQEFPIVIKAAEGCGSRKVYLLNDLKSANRVVKKLSNCIDCRIKRLLDQYKAIIAVKLGKRRYVRIHENKTRKFVIQDYVPNLDSDWKVLVFGNKYYILNRKVRKRDFRASGSGMFSFLDPPDGLLDFAKLVYDKIESPYASLDIANKGKEFHLLEFQALYFGLYTVLNAEYHFEQEEDCWRKVPGKAIIEKEMADSILHFVKRLHIN